jgi:hypothetical protein
MQEQSPTGSTAHKAAAPLKVHLKAYTKAVAMLVRSAQQHAVLCSAALYCAALCCVGVVSRMVWGDVVWCWLFVNEVTHDAKWISAGILCDPVVATHRAST